MASITAPTNALPAAESAVNPSSVTMVAGEFSTGDEQRISSYLDKDEGAGAGEFTEAMLGDDRAQSGLPVGSDLLSEAARAPVDETPSGEKIPEPTTLVLVGTGLIAVACASRRKWPRWKFGRAGVAQTRLETQEV